MVPSRAGEMIPEVEGTRPWGALEEKGPQVSQRTQNHLYNYCSMGGELSKRQGMLFDW